MRDAQPPKRGRPSKADAEREASYAEYVERITTGSPPPGGWPLVQCDFSVQVPKQRNVGRPYDVDPSAPYEQQFEKKLVERFIGNAAWLLRIMKDNYRKQAQAGKYVPARECDKFLEEILAQLLPEFLRLGSKLGDRFGKKFLDQVEELKRLVCGADDSLCLRDDRLDDDRWNFKQKIITRERNLDQIILDRKRAMKGQKSRKNRRKPASEFPCKATQQSALTGCSRSNKGTRACTSCSMPPGSKH
jgi:hypothetical protein